ncbi:uncharacterized protein A4U43_C03F16360 [Asparagus officinalis]|uniref:PABS domain-containing protein n=1 Tax=Asparagus officinalis TaxID=4686 RepID=A0A5P1FFQ4_ASPOF|nr:uncharacterized protein A4U43_C03F16360 [Asparagus officinalis]
MEGAREREREREREAVEAQGERQSPVGYEAGQDPQDLREPLCILHTGAGQYQDIALLDTKPFGKALVIDGKLQSAEIDEFIYHESLVHPALLRHQEYNSLSHLRFILVFRK